MDTNGGYFCSGDTIILMYNHLFNISINCNGLNATMLRIGFSVPKMCDLFGVKSTAWVFADQPLEGDILLHLSI
jgi:hypothetical protein